jgi:RNA polymerase sigma-70 factor (ECF subfamily)
MRSSNACVAVSPTPSVRASRERALAEELLQETWLRLARNARSLAPDTDLRAWLFTVARNLLRSRRRRDSFGRELLRELGLAAERERTETPFEQAVASETLAVIEGLAPAQLAQVLGLRPEAARQRLARARAMLVELLAEPPGLRASAGDAS